MLRNLTTEVEGTQWSALLAGLALLLGLPAAECKWTRVQRRGQECPGGYAVWRRACEYQPDDCGRSGPAGLSRRATLATTTSTSPLTFTLALASGSCG